MLYLWWTFLPVLHEKGPCKVEMTFGNVKKGMELARLVIR